MRILIAEDERRLASAIARGLRREGMAVDVTHDGASALVKARVVDYDVVVLDRDLPGVHGDEVCKTLVAREVLTRLLMLTASGTVAERVEGLGLGADDYLPKPFAYAELVARIRAVGRRVSPATPPVLVHGELRLDPAQRIAARAGARLPLSPKEFAVLEYLLANRGRVISAEELLDRVWDENADPFTTTVRVTMMTLRRKLGEPPIIDTVVGSGYRIDPGVVGAAPEPGTGDGNE